MTIKTGNLKVRIHIEDEIAEIEGLDWRFSIVHFEIDGKSAVERVELS